MSARNRVPGVAFPTLAAWLCVAAPPPSAVHAAPAAGRPSAAAGIVSQIAVAAEAPGELGPAERAFLRRAAELSSQQLRLARLAVSQAAASDVRAFAQQLASDSRQVAESIRALGSKRIGLADSAAAPAVPDVQQRLVLRTGAEFDAAFVDAAAELQGRLLRLFEEVLADAKDPEVRDLAGTSLPTLREHRNRGTELKKTYE